MPITREIDMNTPSKWETYILQQEAGSLSPRKQRALHRALEQDPELRAYKRTLAVARQTITDTEPDNRVSDFTLSRIIQGAERHSPRAPHAASSWTLRLLNWKPALVYGGLSVLVLLLGTALLFQANRPAPAFQSVQTEPGLAEEGRDIVEWDRVFAEEYEALAQQLDTLHTEASEAAWLINDMDEEALAQELLEWEHST